MAAIFDIYRWERSLMARVGYWYGHQYLSARGSWHYQSASWHDPAYTQPLRRMLTADLGFAYNPSTPAGIMLSAMAYYDCDLRAFDFAVSLGLHFGVEHTFRTK